MANVSTIQTPRQKSTVDSVISDVAVSAFVSESNLEDLFELSRSASNVLELVSLGMDELSGSERRVLAMSLNLVKDIAMAKAVAIAQRKS